MSCIHPMKADAIAEYHERYSIEYSLAVKTYLATASSCPVASSEATFAGRYMEYPLFFIGSQDLAFRMDISDEGSVGNASVVHGFATQDPVIMGEGQAFEYIYIWVSR